jgi:hypothetical protein
MRALQPGSQTVQQGIGDSKMEAGDVFAGEKPDGLHVSY